MEIFLQIGVVSGLALSTGLYTSFSNIARLFTSDPVVLMVVKSCSLVHLPTLSLSYHITSIILMFFLHFSLYVPVSQLMLWHSYLMVCIMVSQILIMSLKLRYGNTCLSFFFTLYWFLCHLLAIQIAVGVMSSLVLLYAPSVFGLAGVWAGLTTLMGLRMASGILRWLYFLFCCSNPV